MIFVVIFFKAAEGSGRCVQIAGIFTGILVAQIALRHLGASPTMPINWVVTESEMTLKAQGYLSRWEQHLRGANFNNREILFTML